MSGAKTGKPKTWWSPKSTRRKPPHHNHLASQERVCLKLTEQRCCCCFFFFFLYCFRQVDLSLPSTDSPAFSLFEFIGNLAFLFLFWFLKCLCRIYQVSSFQLQKCFWPGDPLHSILFDATFILSLFLFLFPLFDFAVSHFVVLCWVFSGPSMIGVSIPSLLKVDCSRLSTRLRLLR